MKNLRPPAACSMQLEFFSGDDDPSRAYFAYREPRDAIFDPRGVTVRQAPWRRTVMHRVGERRVFCKHRHGRTGDAHRERAALGTLSGLGLSVPRLLFFAAAGADTVLGLDEVPGRPFDALLREGLEVDRALREMPEVVRRLHGAGLVYRDLYWNHVFGEPGGRGLWLVDVERVLRPRFRFQRWVVKDLAGLVASWPAATPVSGAAGLRFLRRVTGGTRADRRGMVRRILAKAERIRGHETRYPD